jgi:hypothetical protein
VSRRVRFCYLCRPGVAMADVQRFMVVYEARFGVLSPDEARVFPPDVCPAALWHRGMLHVRGIAWLGRN